MFSFWPRYCLFKRHAFGHTMTNCFSRYFKVLCPLLIRFSYAVNFYPYIRLPVIALFLYRCKPTITRFIISIVVFSFKPKAILPSVLYCPVNKPNRRGPLLADRYAPSSISRISMMRFP